MTDDSSRSGFIILFLLVIAATGTALFAFNSTGSKGIEERFENAVGITGDQGAFGGQSGADGNGTGLHPPEGGEGFALEGSPVLYGIVLAVLTAGCILAYRKFWNG